MHPSRIAVIGGGLMGAGIAEVCARAGTEVVVVEATDAAADAARSRIERSLSRAVDAGKLDDAVAASARAALSFSADLDAVHDRQLVIEAIVEQEQAKVALFTRLDELVTDPDAILASNTSSIPIMKLATTTRRPQQVLGIHFFNPVPVLPLVELIPSLSTSPQVEARATAFLTEVLDKQVVRATDRAGFIVNALLIPYLLSAIRMFESGFASREDIDRGMVAGCAHPLGPLALSDLIGLDTVKAVADSMYDEFRDRACVAPPLLCRMVEAGLLGRKTGQGFYEYPSGAPTGQGSRSAA